MRNVIKYLFDQIIAQHQKIISFIFLILTFLLRLINSGTPLWLDEMYGFRLAEVGFCEIVLNSWTDPHPPLYYIILWITTFFGNIRNEILIRSTSILFGAALVVVFYFLCIKIKANYFWTILLITAPSLIFYSQDARPYSLLILLSALSLYFFIEIISSPNSKSFMLLWFFINLIGLYTGYCFLMITMVQVVFLGIKNYKNKSFWNAALGLVLLSIPLIMYASSSLTKTATAHIDSQPLTVYRTLQTVLAGESLRYGLSLGHYIYPIIIIFFLTVVTFSAIKTQSLLNLYLSIQIIFPLISLIILRRVFNVILPLPEAKQYMVLFPVLILLFPLVWDRPVKSLFMQRIKHIIFLLVISILILSNSLGLIKYWNTPKSAISNAATAFFEYVPTDENIASLHYNFDYLLGFYEPNNMIYMGPKKTELSYVFKLIPAADIFDAWEEYDYDSSVNDIREEHYYWLLTHPSSEPIENILTNQCEKIDYSGLFPEASPYKFIKVSCH